MKIENLKIEKWEEEEGKTFEKWTWSHKVYDSFLDTYIVREYQTNDFGEGIFKYIYGAGWQQVSGALDFFPAWTYPVGCKTKTQSPF